MHTPQIIEVRELNDENIAYLVRCCDDSKTDSWLTVSVHLSDEEHDKTLNAHNERVGATHHKKIERLAKARTLVKTENINGN